MEGEIGLEEIEKYDTGRYHFICALRVFLNKSYHI